MFRGYEVAHFAGRRYKSIGMASRSHKAVAMQTLLVVLPCTAVISAAVAATAYRRGLSKGAALAGEGGGKGVGVPDGVCPTEEEDEQEVERVLSVWFDGSTADNHRTKWFAQVRKLFLVVRCCWCWCWCWSLSVAPLLR